MKSTPFPKILFVLFLIALMILLTATSCDPFMKISDAVTIGDNWVELHPSTPLKSNNGVHKVICALEPPFDSSIGIDLHHNGVLMPNGDVIRPEVELIGQDGNHYSLPLDGLSKGQVDFDTPYNVELPPGQEYTTVRLRSPQPIRCTQILWQFDRGWLDNAF